MSYETLRPGDILEKSTKRLRYWQENSLEVTFTFVISRLSLILDIGEVAEKVRTLFIRSVMNVRSFDNHDLA